MLIQQPNTEDTEVVTTVHVCEYHKKNPSDWSYAGCTCSGPFSYRRKGFDQQDKALAGDK